MPLSFFGNNVSTVATAQTKNVPWAFPSTQRAITRYIGFADPDSTQWSVRSDTPAWIGGFPVNRPAVSRHRATRAASASNAAVASVGCGIRVGGFGVRELLAIARDLCRIGRAFVRV